MAIVLATAAVICVDPHTKLADHQLRREQYVRACTWWLSQAAVDKLVVCENSSDHLLGEQLESIAGRRGKQFEYLTFAGDVYKTSSRGKGFGDGEIIEYALHHSATLSTSRDGFYKITGRLTVRNFAEIDKEVKGSQSRFKLMSTRLRRDHQVDTRFFYVRPNFYASTLIDAYRTVNDREGRYLEHVFYEALKGSREIAGMPRYPVIEGQSATMNVNYGNMRWPIVKEIANRFRMYDV